MNGDGCSDKCLVEYGWSCSVNITNATTTQEDDIFSDCVNVHLGNFHIDLDYHEQCDEGASTDSPDPNYASGGCYNGWLKEDYVCNPDNG